MTLNDIIRQIVFPLVIAAGITTILHVIMKRHATLAMRNPHKAVDDLKGFKSSENDRMILVGFLAFIFFQIMVRFWSRMLINPEGYLVKHYDELNFYQNVQRILKGESFLDPSSDLFWNRDGYLFHLLFALLTRELSASFPLTLKDWLDVYAIFVYPMLFSPIAYSSFKHLLGEKDRALVLLYLVGFFDYFLFNSTEVRPENVAYLFLYPTIVLMIKGLHEGECKHVNVFKLFILTFIVFLIHFLTFFFLFLFFIASTFLFLLLKPLSDNHSELLSRQKQVKRLMLLEGLLTVLLASGLLVYMNLYIFVSIQLPSFVPIMFNLSRQLHVSLLITWVAMWSVLLIIFVVTVLATQHLVIKNLEHVQNHVLMFVSQIRTRTLEMLNSDQKIFVMSFLMTIIACVLIMIPLSPELVYYRNVLGFVFINAWKIALLWVIIHSLVTQFLSNDHFFNSIENVAFFCTMATSIILFILSFVIYNIILRFVAQFLPFILIVILPQLPFSMVTSTRPKKESLARGELATLLVAYFVVLWGIFASIMNAARVPLLFYS